MRKYLFFLVALFVFSPLSLRAEERWRDPFTPPDVELIPPPEETAPLPVASELRLTGTLRSKKSSRAIINDLIVKEGDKLGDFRIISIERKRVVLEKDGVRYLLNLGTKQSFE